VSEESAVGALIAEWARLHKHEPVAVRDLRTAPSVASSMQPDAAILSVEGSSTTALALLRGIRASVPTVAAIVLSTGTDPALDANVSRLEGTAVVKKPIALDVLAGTLAKLVPSRTA
jgi:DNA-binding response OmpR family regulator